MSVLFIVKGEHMFVAIALFVLYLIMISLLDRTGWSKKDQHEWFIALTSGVAFVYVLVAGMWLVAMFASTHPQSPSFSLWPYIILGVVTTIAAIRSSVVYNQKYGVTLT